MHSPSAPFRTTNPVLDALNEAHAQALQDGALSRKTKELIALTTAVTMRCNPSIAYHLHNALQARATTQEVTEALEVAMVTLNEPTALHANRVVTALTTGTVDDVFPYADAFHPNMVRD